MPFRVAIASIAATVLVVLLHAQENPRPASPSDWPMYNRDLPGTRHSPLTQITPANVARLRQAWSFKVGTDQTSGGITGGSEYTPIVVDGRMYVLTADSAYALEPETGKPIWHYPVPGGVPSRRGMGYWTGPKAD